jgi:hypothetical protein
MYLKGKGYAEERIFVTLIWRIRKALRHESRGNNTIHRTPRTYENIFVASNLAM